MRIEFAPHDHIIRQASPRTRPMRAAHCIGCGLCVDALLSFGGDVLVREGSENVQVNCRASRADELGRA